MNEIRSRALDNLLSKLDVPYSIGERDLVDNRQLFVNLFELLNYADFNRKETVLKLLARLSKVSDLGADR